MGRATRDKGGGARPVAATAQGQQRRRHVTTADAHRHPLQQRKRHEYNNNDDEYDNDVFPDDDLYRQRCRAHRPASLVYVSSSCLPYGYEVVLRFQNLLLTSLAGSPKTMAAATAGPLAILTVPVTRCCAMETGLRSDCVQQGASLVCRGPSNRRPVPRQSVNRHPVEGY